MGATDAFTANKPRRDVVGIRPSKALCFVPGTREDFINRASQHLLQAATLLNLGAKVSSEGEEVGSLVNVAQAAEDWANFLIPVSADADWPKEGAEIYDITTGKRVN